MHKPSPLFYFFSSTTFLLGMIMPAIQVSTPCFHILDTELLSLCVTSFLFFYFFNVQWTSIHSSTHVNNKTDTFLKYLKASFIHSLVDLKCSTCTFQPKCTLDHMFCYVCPVFISLLTYKGLYMCAGISTFRAAKLTSPLAWSSRARESLPFTDAFLCKHDIKLRLYRLFLVQSGVVFYSGRWLWVRFILPEDYLSTITIFCCPIFRGIADSSLWKWPHPYPGG